MPVLTRLNVYASKATKMWQIGMIMLVKIGESRLRKASSMCILSRQISLRLKTK